MADITPTTGLVDVRYGPDAHMRYDVAQHPSQDVGGNPCVLWRNGGGWTTNDKRQPFISNQRGNNLFETLLNKRGASEMHFTCISYGTRQAAWGSPNTTHGSNSTIGWYSEVPTVPTFFPECLEDTKRAILHVKQNAKLLNIDPNRIVIGGTSAGAVNAWYSQFTEPMVAPAQSADTRQTRYLGGGNVDSRCCGTLLHICPTDFRKTTLTVRKCDWTAATKTITFSATSIPTAAQNPFGLTATRNYEPASSGTVVRIWGTGTTPGVYVVSSVTYTNGANTMVLTEEIAAGDLVGTVNLELPNEVESVQESVWSRGLAGTNALSETWLLPDSFRAAVSLQHYVENRLMRWAPPLNYLTYETYSATDFKPFATGHEGLQFDLLMAAAERSGVRSYFGGNKAGGASITIPSGDELYPVMRRMCEQPMTKTERAYPVGSAR